MRIGVLASMVPVAVKSRASDRCPSWKIQTMAPNVALSDSTFSTSALSGMTTEPKRRKRSTNVMPAMIARASGMRSNSAALASTSCADCPVTSTS